MMLLYFLYCYLVLGLCVTVEAQFPTDKNIDPSLDLDSLANNSLYLRWRPQYHILPPGGWMNDPCGPLYDPTRGLYHIFYQSHPQHVQFGKISWSHATSPNLVEWTDITGYRNQSPIAIATGSYGEYDWIGAFSGGAYPVNLHGETDGNLTLMYTGASKWPDNWKLPYAEDTEQQGIATSSDGGQTWQKYSGNPVLADVPPGWNVTGLRDPIFQPMPELDTILGQTEPHFYMIMGSGIRDVGPRLPLYTAKASDLTKWSFLGALFEVPINLSFSGDVARTGSFGGNFELAGFFSLPEKEANGGDGKSLHFISTMGSEDYEREVHPRINWQTFAMGNVAARANGSAEMTLTAAGVLDWGNFYAANQFYDPKKDRRVLWGWSSEEMNSYGVKAQGFQGSLGLPREVYILKKHNVLVPSSGVLKGPEVWTPEVGGKTFTVTTLAQRPLPDVVDALQSELWEHGSVAVSAGNVTMLPEMKSSQHLHMQARIAVVPDNSTLSFLFRASPGLEEYTKLIYQPHNSSVLLVREHSSLIANFSNLPFTGSFSPYTYLNTSTGHSTTEPIVLDLFLDGSLFEVFINDRFAMTQRIYPSRADATGLGFRIDPVNGDYENYDSDGGARLEDVKVWSSMRGVWPNRPMNASSPLVYDGYNETHLTFDNPYVEPYTQIYEGYKT